MNHETIQQKFNRYLQTVYTNPKTRPLPKTVQYQELQRCFYGAYFCAIGDINEVSNKLPEEQACSRLEMWMTEVQVYSQSVLAEG